jgi:hypothetical protein
LLKELKCDEEWHRYNYFKTFDLSIENLPDNIERIDINQVTPEAFIENYEKLYKPVIITNSQNDWQAKEKWTLEVCLFLFLSRIKNFEKF